jgi:hypothetical protein
VLIAGISAQLDVVQFAKAATAVVCFLLVGVRRAPQEQRWCRGFHGIGMIKSQRWAHHP